jgi:two-component system, OmpR family, response regulator VanR
MRVLVIEDDEVMAGAIQVGLQQAGMAVDAVHEAESALLQLELVPYDAAVLDRDLPGLHGDELCRLIVERHPGCRILMLTAARRSADAVAGLELGADDYLTKPFEFPVLAARLRALHRRGPVAVPLTLAAGDVRLDPFRRRAQRAGRDLALTRKEFAVLELLLRADGGTLSAEQLLDKAWDSNADPFTNAVRITVSTLRAKLGSPPVIETVTGVGYRLAGS